MIRLRGTASILTWTAHSMWEIGKKISKMAKGRRPGLMELNMKVITSWAKNTVKVLSSGPTGLFIKANSNKTTLRVRASIAGRTAEAIVGPGETTRWMAGEFSLGQTAVDTKESTSRIRNKVSAPFIGLMEENT